MNTKKFTEKLELLDLDNFTTKICKYCETIVTHLNKRDLKLHLTNYHQKEIEEEFEL